MKQVAMSGKAFGYEERGRGDALVLLHGFLCDSRAWRPQLEGLSGRVRVVAPDLPGCGRSPDPPEDWSLTDYAGWLAAFLDAVGVETADIAGLSWGGVLAQEFYRLHPARVRSLILAGAYAGWGPSLGWEAARERLAGCERLSRGEPADLVAAMIGGMFSRDAPTEVVEELSGVFREFHPSGFRTMARILAEADTPSVWRTIDVPTLLVWGEQDARSPLQIARAMQQGIPGSRLVVVPGGHVCNMESPGPFNKAVEESLAGR